MAKTLKPTAGTVPAKAAWITPMFYVADDGSLWCQPNNGYPDFLVDTGPSGNVQTRNRSFLLTSTPPATLAPSTDYVFTTGSPTSLPDIGTIVGGSYITIKNRSASTITISAYNATSQIYSTSAIATLTLTAGQAVTLMPDGTYWNVE